MNGFHYSENSSLPAKQFVFLPYVSPGLVSVTAICSPCMFYLFNTYLDDNLSFCYLRMFVTMPLVDMKYINCYYLSELLVLDKQYTWCQDVMLLIRRC